MSKLKYSIPLLFLLVDLFVINNMVMANSFCPICGAIAPKVMPKPHYSAPAHPPSVAPPAPDTGSQQDWDEYLDGKGMPEELDETPKDVDWTRGKSQEEDEYEDNEGNPAYPDAGSRECPLVNKACDDRQDQPGDNPTEDSYQETIWS